MRIPKPSPGERWHQHQQEWEKAARYQRRTTLSIALTYTVFVIGRELRYSRTSSRCISSTSPEVRS